MVTEEDVREIALSLPGTEASQHFDNRDFRVRNKIFVSLPGGTGELISVRITADEQAALIAENPDSFIPANGVWGRRGWTLVVLASVDRDQVRELITESWRQLAPKGVVAAFDAEQTD